jgi:hypothetical protein
MIFLIHLCLASEDYGSLISLVMNNEDERITAQDLAFLLATHGFDAMPKDGYAVVKLNETVYILTPNGDKPGLADITMEEP